MIAEIAALIFATGLGAQSLPFVMYRPADRSVSNWRFQSLRNLDLDAKNALAIVAGKEPTRLPRCVKLNNYWCIKSARWNGEIATDNEGHVAFSSATEGAAVAVALLRRYYLDFGRKSALSIVSRWAPAQCGSIAARAPVVRRGAKSRADHLATRGIGNTLRARFLANRGRGFARGNGKAKGNITARPRLARSLVPDRPIPMMRAPAIASGMGERPVRLAALAPLVGPSASVAARIGASDKGAAAVPRISCSGEAVRIRNYANAVINGVAKTIDEDLKLFEPHGAPSPQLARVMANMAAVEIGPYRAADTLVSRVVGEAVREADIRRAKAEAEAEAPPANTPRAAVR